MAEAERKGHTITFDVLYYAKSRGKVDRMVEIGEKEGEYIRMYHPILNTQIPHEDNWHKHDMNLLSEEDIFIYGFRMGARMILDVVGDHKGQFYEIGDVG